MKIIHVAGARPNFVKIASVLRACAQHPEIDSVLVHTGQHYSAKMSQSFFDELGIKKPDLNLEVGSGSHAQQTAEVMKRFEAVVGEYKPDVVLVVGDVNSTVACALVSVKLGAKVAHVEAGLRSFDRTMPEEINRILTDAMSDILFVTERSGLENLRREGIPGEKVHFVGNVMIDTLLRNRTVAERSDVLQRLEITTKEYAVVTLHRPSNVDVPAVFDRIVDAFEEIQKDVKMIFPIHPRTVKNIQGNGIMKRLNALPNMVLVEPLGYLDFLKLMAHAKVVLTDSGGIQEETTILRVPCLTLRDNTERPATITEGTNILVGTNPERVVSGYHQSVGGSEPANGPELWDGRASDRIADILLTLA